MSNESPKPFVVSLSNHDRQCRLSIGGVILALPLGGLGVYSTVFEDESNCLPKVTPSIFLCSSLAVGAWDFGTMRYVPVAILLNDGSEFTLHLRLPQSAFNRTP